MLAVLSPAKKLDFTEPPAEIPTSRPRFAADAGVLIAELRKKTVSEVAGLMRLSDQLATLNHQRYGTFDLGGADTGADRKQAVLAFAGDTYVGLDAGTLSIDDLTYAGDHLRILSGLYGVLRPLDLIQPYRLEMGTKLGTSRGSTLYEFWGSAIAEALDADLGGGGVVLNLASAEYVKAIDTDALAATVITPTFKETRDGVAKVIGLVAKRSRGSMARWVIQERVEDPADLSSFDVGGYTFDAAGSGPHAPVFVR